MSPIAFIPKGHLYFLSPIGLQQLLHDCLGMSVAFILLSLASLFLFWFVEFHHWSIWVLFWFGFGSCLIEFMFLIISSAAQSNCKKLFLGSLGYCFLQSVLCFMPAMLISLLSLYFPAKCLLSYHIASFRLAHASSRQLCSVFLLALTKRKLILSETLSTLPGVFFPFQILF